MPLLLLCCDCKFLQELIFEHELCMSADLPLLDYHIMYELRHNPMKIILFSAGARRYISSN